MQSVPPSAPAAADTPPTLAPSRRAGAGRAAAAATAAALLAALAFLLAAFPARNADLWGRLAAGRRLAAGGLAALTAGPASLPRDWLFDLAAYAAHAAAGDTGLAAAKSLLVVALALLLFRLGRPERGWPLPAACAALALLAASTRLLPQPALASCLALALAWGLALAGPAPWRALLPPWPLILLVLAWTNIDSRVSLGLAVVALAWLGRVLDEPLDPDPASSGGGRVRRLDRILALLAPLTVLVLASLLNLAAPFRLTWPPEWTGPGAPVASPFRREYLAAFANSPAGLAYFPLLALSGLSFLAVRPFPAWRRLLPWLTLALTSAAEARAIPFFAVVAGPVLAANLQDARAASLAAGRTARRAARAGWLPGLAVLAALAALVVAAWPGWLQGPPYGPRRLALEPPPAVVRAARTVCDWHEAAAPQDAARAVHLSPATADLFAWFCPHDAFAPDDRLAAAVAALAIAADGDDDAADALRQAGVTHVVALASDHRLDPVLVRLFADPRQWPLLAIHGDVAVFGWRDPAARAEPALWQGRELDLDRPAFHPGRADLAPHRPPERPADEWPWLAAFQKTATAADFTDREQAALHLLQLEAIQRTAPFRHRDTWEITGAAGLVAAAGAWTAPVPALPEAARRLGMLRPRLPVPGEKPAPIDALALQTYQAQALAAGDVPPALPFLAVRAARRAVAAHPDDARAHLLLGEAYLHLLYATRERAWARRFPQLLQLRQAQAAAALARAAELDPTLARARLRLGAYYRDLGYLDLALEELRAAARLGRARPAAADDPRARLDEEIARLESDVAQRRNLVAAGPGGLAYDKAALAMKHGLAGQARDLLLASDVAAFGDQGMALELELLLRTGRPGPVRDWTQPEHRPVLGATSYHWLRAQALAALGDYALAAAELAELERSLAPAGQEALPPQAVMAMLVGRTVLGVQPSWGGLPARLGGVRDQVEAYSHLATLAAVLRRQADVRVLRGLLALEEGDVAEAEAAFLKALAVAPGGLDAPDSDGRDSRDSRDGRDSGGVDFAGRPVARACLTLLTGPPAGPPAGPPPAPSHGPGRN